jgi:predicted Ser/Thr protein kinase
MHRAHRLRVNADRGATALNPLIGRVIDDRYQIAGVLGRGGMATVYLARDRRLGREVAVKVLRPDLAGDGGFLRRFQREAAAAAALSSHPNVVAIHDIGQDRDLHYIVMEYVEGETLTDLIEREAPLAVPRAFALGAQIVSALDAAHRRGLIHRDVKPQNVLIAPDGQVKVADFGIARHSASTSSTEPGSVMGTPDYLSPEQARGAEVGPASDLYSLGVVLYEMLAGHRPFAADTPLGVAMQHVQDDPPPLAAAVPPRAAAVVRRALAKNPSRRYRSAGEMRAALAGAAGGEATVYRPIGLHVPSRRRFLSTGMPFGAALVLAACLAGWAVSHGTPRHHKGAQPTPRPAAAHSASPTSIPATAAPPTAAPPTAVPTSVAAPTSVPLAPAPAQPAQPPAAPPGQRPHGHGPGDHGPGPKPGHGPKGGPRGGRGG